MRTHRKRRLGGWSGEASERSNSNQGPDHSEKVSHESVCRRVLLPNRVGGNQGFNTRRSEGCD